MLVSYYLEVNHFPEAFKIGGSDFFLCWFVFKLIDEPGELSESLALEELRLADNSADGACLFLGYVVRNKKMVPSAAEFLQSEIFSFD